MELNIWLPLRRETTCPYVGNVYHTNIHRCTHTCARAHTHTHTHTHTHWMVIYAPCGMVPVYSNNLCLLGKQTLLYAKSITRVHTEIVIKGILDILVCMLWPTNNVMVLCPTQEIWSGSFHAKLQSLVHVWKIINLVIALAVMVTWHCLWHTHLLGPQPHASGVRT